MKLYLALSSALEVMRHLRAIDAGKVEGTPVRARRLTNAISTVRGIDELDPTAQRILSHVDGPIHLYVNDHARTHSNEKFVAHVLSKAVPYGAFIDIGHDICISSPAFLMTQLALTLDLIDLLIVSMELCGAYSRWALPVSDPKLIPRNEWEENRNVTFKLQPATSAKAIRRLLGRMKGWRGVKKTRQALRWLADYSASPMETAVYLQLCLPRHLGGYGFPKATLNPKLIIEAPDGKEERFPDIFWRLSERLAVDTEYQSDYAHTGDWKRYRDSRRAVVMIAAEITVVPLTRPQVLNTDEFDRFAQSLRKILKVRKRPMERDWRFKRNELRSKVLRFD